MSEIIKYGHVMFLVHGMGEACDLPLRPIEDCGIHLFYE
jgi:hypothetical protein